MKSKYIVKYINVDDIVKFEEVEAEGKLGAIAKVQDLIKTLKVTKKD